MHEILIKTTINSMRKANGGGGSRTRVRRCLEAGDYVRIPRFVFSSNSHGRDFKERYPLKSRKAFRGW